MKRRILSVLLVTILAVSLVAISAVAAGTNTQNALVEEGKRIAAAAKAMTFPEGVTSHVAECPIHGSVTWTALTPEGAFTMAKDSHYYLTASVTNSTVSFTAPNNSKNTTCLHLNNKTITNTAGSVLIGKTGQMHVMGEGKIIGGTTGATAGAAASISCGTAAGQINLYSGTYGKYDSGNSSNVLCVGYNGGVINLYADALVQGGTGGSAVYMRYNTAYTGAFCNMYGGTIDATNNTEVAVDMEAVSGGKFKEMVFSMYAGEIKNGNGTSGGNVIVRDGDVFNMYGGKISGGAASNGGNIYLDAGATFHMSGGTISGGNASYGGNVYIRNGAVCTISGGTVETGNASTGGGNIAVYGGGKLDLQSGTVTNGVAASNGGNIYLTNYVTDTEKVQAVFTMSGGTVSGSRDKDGNAIGGKAVNGGNIFLYTGSTANITGGIIENGTAEQQGGNISLKPASSANAADYPTVNLENTIIRGGKTTASSNSYGGANVSVMRGNLYIAEGTQILNGNTASRGGNLRVYIGTVVMTGGEMSGGTAGRSSGYEEIHMEGANSSNLSVMYMLGGKITGKETGGENAVQLNAYSKLYLGGTATIANKDPQNDDLFIYESQNNGSGKLLICDGWSGSVAVDGTNIAWNSGANISTDKIQVVTLDADRNETVGGRFTGKLINLGTGVILIGSGNANGTVLSGGLAMVDKDGNVTMTTDPLTLWATGNYAYIRLFNNYTVNTPDSALWIDLNGFALTVTGNGEVNAFDTSGDTFQVPTGSVTVTSGEAAVARDLVAPNGNRYLATEQDGKITMHRLEIRVAYVTLRPSAAGVYYKAAYNCDSVISGMIETYGVVLSVYDMPGADFASQKETNKYQYTVAKTPFESGIISNSGSVFGIMKDSREADLNERYGRVKIYANPYIQLKTTREILVGDNKNAGKTVDSEGFNGVALSLKDVLEGIDKTYYDYKLENRRSIDQFYLDWENKGMGSWEFENIGTQTGKFDNCPLEFDEGSNMAFCSACEQKVAWTAFSQSADTTAKIGVAANGAHYYLAEDITYTESGNVGFITSPTAKNNTACLHLNGHNLTATAGAAIYSPYAQMGTLNVLGEGTVSGNRSGAGTTVYLSSQAADGRINLYGGTYVQPASNGGSMVAIINGGSIHAYDGAWIKGNGSGNAVYMDLAKNAAAAFGVHGGKITGGELAVAQDDSPKARSVTVDGRSKVEQMTIRNEKITVEIAGAPTIDYLAMTAGTKLTVGTLVKGAKIGISAQNGAFTTPFDKAQTYADYFFAWNEPDSISVTDAGELSYDINYEHYMTSYQRDVKAQAIADGKIHYYFMAAKGMVMSPTNGGDIDKWGDSCLVVFPNGETMLIDAGYAVQAPVIIGSLKRMGVTNLDYLLITHPHGDHIGGAFSSGVTFLDEITVEQVYYQDLQYNNGWDGVLESKCEAKGIPYTALWKGDVLTFGQGDKAVTMTLLWPGEDADLTIDSAANNNSMVFRFDYGEHSSLFTADIYTATETKLRGLYTNGELDVDMMKVPHHGLALSSSSLAFLQAVAPEIAVATGSFDINDTINTRYTSTDASKGVGATLLEDRFHGYIHISSGTDGVMATETETQNES